MLFQEATMNSHLRAWGLLALEMAGGGLLILALSGGLCLTLVGGQCTLRSYSALAQNLGLTVLGLGALSLAGAAAFGRSGNYQSARTVAVANTFQRAQQDARDSTRRLRFILLATGAGALALLAGLWLSLGLG
jgi:hypothetical protein